MINNLKDLKSLFKLCRTQGITDFEMGEIKIKFGEMPAQLQSDDDDIANPIARQAREEFMRDPLNDPMAYFSAPQIDSSELTESMT